MKKCILLFILVCTLGIQVQAQRRTAVSPQMFDKIIKDINFKQNYREKYSYAENVVTRHDLTTRQLIEICYLFPKQVVKYNLALAAYPNIADKNNFFDVYDLFSNLSLAMQLYHNTQANNYNGYYKTPSRGPQPPHQSGNRNYTEKMNCEVSPNEFDYIMKTIKEQVFDDKMESMAKRHIEKECFSKQQFRQILTLFSRDGNILYLIKFSYDFVPYRKDMFEFRDLLDFSSSKKELDEFLIEKR